MIQVQQKNQGIRETVRLEAATLQEKIKLLKNENLLRLPGEFMHSRRLNIILGERGEVALDSDDDSEAETSKIHNESTSEDLD